MFWCSGFQEEGECFKTLWPFWFIKLFPKLHSKLLLHSNPAKNASPAIFFWEQLGESLTLEETVPFPCHFRKDRENQASSIPHCRRPCLTPWPAVWGACRSPAAQELDGDPIGGLWNTQNQETREDGWQQCKCTCLFTVCCVTETTIHEIQDLENKNVCFPRIWSDHVADV